MTERPLFRFLHTGDFQLGMVPYGIDNVPDSVANRLLDSTWESVGRVFSTAIQNQVDFVLLTGDLVANGYGSSPRTIEFLRDQFFRLQSVGIAVYCSRDCFAFNRPSNATATTGWPEWCELPANVHFLSDRDPVVVHTENNRLLAEIVTAGNSARTDVFSIQVLASSKKLPAIMSIMRPPAESTNAVSLARTIKFGRAAVRRDVHQTVLANAVV